MDLNDLNQIVKTPELDVVRVVSLKNDAILLVKEIDDINWKLPGGKIHQDETILEAFKREIEEELGFVPEKEDILNYIHTNIPNSENIRHIILIKEVEADQIKKTNEVAEAKYFKLSDLPKTKFAEHITSAASLISS